MSDNSATAIMNILSVCLVNLFAKYHPGFGKVNIKFTLKVMKSISYRLYQPYGNLIYLIIDDLEKKPGTMLQNIACFAFIPVND